MKYMFRPLAAEVPEQGVDCCKPYISRRRAVCPFGFQPAKELFHAFRGYIGNLQGFGSFSMDIGHKCNQQHNGIPVGEDCIRTQVPGGNKIFHDELIDQHGEISRLHKAS